MEWTATAWERKIEIVYDAHDSTHARGGVCGGGGRGVGRGGGQWRGEGVNGKWTITDQRWVNFRRENV